MAFKAIFSRRKIAVVFLQIEGISLLIVGFLFIVKGITSETQTEWFLISGIMILTLLGGAGLLVAANGINNYKRYGRAPAVLSNLIAIGVSKYMYEANLLWIALPLTVYAALTIYLVLSTISE